MHDTNDPNSIWGDLKVNRVPPNVTVAVAWPDVVTGWGDLWLLRQLFECLRHNSNVTIGLLYAPRLSAIKPDVFKIALCCRSKTVFSHMFLTFFS